MALRTRCVSLASSLQAEVRCTAAGTTTMLSGTGANISLAQAQQFNVKSTPATTRHAILNQGAPSPSRHPGSSLRTKAVGIVAATTPMLSPLANECQTHHSKACGYHGGSGQKRDSKAATIH
ncbi:hypothetical protein OIU74_008521 [Salix koriyanagi]|uniref:Uncharacterized protein n=1 Tax=Salix koriyanagi TaxID=2511006 RepID=A0A9Q0TQ94_9ROSI|nr:hypothetical protein OIU74_008521 [Salix koriyanagi]